MTLPVTQAALETACRLWQQRLRLQDWHIEIRFARRHEMATAFGETIVKKYTRGASIKLLDPIDFEPKDGPRERDLDDTLVHELLHLHLYDLNIVDAKEGDEPNALELAQERAIDAIAGALVALERRVRG